MDATAAVAAAGNPFNTTVVEHGSTIAVRLADEGIPVRAIARALHIPSGDLYELFRDAILTGTLIEIPKDDWPPGSGRNTRSVFNGTPLEQDQSLRCACARFFKTSPLEAAMLATMLKRNEITKDQLHAVIEQNRPTPQKDETDLKMVDVMICKLRKKLTPHNISIQTMWGMGYLIPSDDRERAIHLLVTSAGVN